MILSLAIIAAVLAPSVIFVAWRLWVTRNDPPGGWQQ